uniref:patatin-like phospholipase family protein n=1 Tax=Alistipes putredinis TaxID=28117 RepID=UPI00242C3C96
AMYAAGYSPAEMREIVASGVVKDWVSGRIDPRYTPYYRQIGHNPAFLSVRMNVGGAGKRFRVTNLLSSTPIDMALTELFAPATAAAEGDFDRLMVPFLCVSSDMNAREPVVMRNGDLSEAVRSSMSIPLVFKPMKKDSMLLYDGGIYDNFPWRPLDVGFRPDLIVGSICTAGNAPPSENSSILDQAFMLAMHDTDYDLPKGRSVTVRRAVDVNMLDFNSAVAIMDAGYADATAGMPQILERVSERWSPERYAERREEFRAKWPPLWFSDYKLEGLAEAPESYIRDFVKVDRRTPGRQRPMGFEELRDNLYAVLAGGDFTMDFPHVRYDSLRGSYSFAAQFHTKPNFKLTIGGNISSTAFNQAFIGFDYHTIRRVSQWAFAGIYIGPTYATGSLGGRTDFYLWKPFSLDYSYNFEVLNLRHGNFGNLTPIDNTESVKNNQGFLSIGLTMPLTHNSLASLRFNGGQQAYRYDAPFPDTDPDTDLTRFSFFSTKLDIARNTLDKILYPRRGSEISLSGIYITGRERYKPAEFGRKRSFNAHREWFGAKFQWNRYFDLPGCKWFSFGFNIDAVWTTHPRFQTETATLMSLPAYQPVVHSQMAFMPDYRAKNFLAGGLMPTFDLLPNFFLRTGFYAMYRDNRGLPGEKMQYITEASFVYHTPIGPVSLSLTKYDLKSWHNMYLTFNFGYAIFAPSGHFY